MKSRLVRLVVLVGIATLLLGVGMVIRTAPVAHAAPQAGGTFTVNSTADNTTKDSVLTLREAIMLANGGTGASGLGRTLNDGEKAQLSGCSWSGSSNNWTITASSCGESITDTINFNLSIGSVIALTSFLPLINDSAATTIDGAGVGPLIDASGVGAHNGLALISNGNTIQHVGVTGVPSPNADFYVTGNNNTLSDVWAWNAGADGISVAGDSNTITSSRIGVFLGSYNNCGTGSVFKANGRYGIYLNNGAQYNAISNNYISCNGSFGIYIAPTAGRNNYIGPNNVIGTNSAKTANLGNGASGVALETLSNAVMNNTIAFNYQGVYVTGGDSIIGGNAIISNTVSGIWVESTSGNDTIGCSLWVCAKGAPNQISGNGYYGISVASVSFEDIYSNDIGASARFVPAQGNAGGGILVNGAIQAHIGDAGILSNTINNNLGAGIRMENGGGADSVLSNMISGNHADGIIITGTTTTQNTVANNNIQSNWLNGVHIYAASSNTIGGNQGANTIDSNWWDGVLVEQGAHLNNISSNSIGHLNQGNQRFGVYLYANAYQNTIQNNTLRSNGNSGVYIESVDTYSNTVKSNLIEGSTNFGIALYQAHDNIIGGNTLADINTIDGIGGDGIYVYNSAHNNSILNAVVYSNTKNGIEFADSGTIDNSVFGSLIYNNGQDGINENNSADYNTWSTTLTYSNGGLGIDKNAPIINQNNITPPFPIITSMQKVGSNMQFVGTASPSVGGVQSVSIEIYQAAVDPSGYGEGGQYVANATATAGGSWTRTVAGNLTGCYTAVQTLHFTNGHSTSSEYGPNQCPKLYLPLIMR